MGSIAPRTAPPSARPAPSAESGHRTSGGNEPLSTTQPDDGHRRDQRTGVGRHARRPPRRRRADGHRRPARRRPPHRRRAADGDRPGPDRSGRHHRGARQDRPPRREHQPGGGDTGRPWHHHRGRGRHRARCGRLHRPRRRRRGAPRRSRRPRRRGGAPGPGPRREHVPMSCSRRTPSPGRAAASWCCTSGHRPTDRAGTNGDDPIRQSDRVRRRARPRPPHSNGQTVRRSDGQTVRRSVGQSVSNS